MAFNPDAFLADDNYVAKNDSPTGGFDPDAFLADDNDIAQNQNTEPVSQPSIEGNVNQSPRAYQRQKQKEQRQKVEEDYGEARDLPSIGESPELNQMSVPAFLSSLAATFTFGDDELGKILQGQYPETKIEKDKEGNTIAVFPSGRYAINKPGFSAQDVSKIFGAASVAIPGARVATGLGGGIVKQAAVQGIAASAAESTIQAGQAAGGGEFDLSDVAIAGTFGGGAEFIAPLFRSLRDGFKSFKVGKEAKGVADTAINEEAAIKQFRSIYSQQKGLQDTLKNLGINPKRLEEMAINALREAPSNANPEEVIASALFKELDIPTLKSRITQEGGQFQAEQELRARGDVFGEQVRDRAAEESVGFQNSLRNIIDDIGLPEESGEIIKEVLEERKSMLGVGIRKAYNRLKKLDGEGLPVFTRSIKENFNRSSRIKRLARNEPVAYKQLQDTLVEFGVLRDADLIKKFGDSENIQPLTVDNAEKFRQALNELVDPTKKAQTGSVKEIINRLDGEMKVLDDSLKSGDLGSAGKKAKAKIDAQRVARGVTRGMKKEFNEAGIVGKLIMPKRGNYDIQMIEADNVVKQLMSRSKTKPTYENINRVMNSLEKSGKKGKRAIGNLQASVVMTLLEESTKGLSSKMKKGVIGFSGVNYRKALSGLGKKEMNRLFRDSPEILKTLDKLSLAAELTQPISDVMNSSQSGVIIKNFISEKLRMVPGLSSAAKGVGDVAQRKQTQKLARKALQASWDRTKRTSLARYPKITDIILQDKAPAYIQPAAQAERGRQKVKENNTKTKL